MSPTDHPLKLRHLFVFDGRRLLTHALIVVIGLLMVAALQTSGLWLSYTIDVLSDNVLITAVFPGDPSEEERAALERAIFEEERADISEAFSPSTARERLEGLGIDVDSLDPFAFQDQPWGFSFKWSGMALDPQAFETFASGLRRDHGVELHYDRSHLADLRAMELTLSDLLRALVRVVISLFLLALALSSLLLGRPHFPVSLTRTEMLQALAMRALAAALLGWLAVALAVIVIPQPITRANGLGTWLSMWWILIAVPAFSPLGLIWQRRG